MSIFSRSNHDALDASQALPGRAAPAVLTDDHAVLGTPLQGPFPAGLEQIVLAMGCYWGAERKLWQVPGLYTTAVGYAGGFTPNPTYPETCTGRTGHTEAVLVVYDPAQVSTEELLRVFWEGHDPTQRNRQGNDVGTQYRSGIYTTTPEQLAVVQASRATYQDALTAAHKGEITTEIAPLDTFYYEGDAVHQQYLHKNPAGYCGLGGTGVSCPVGVGISAD